MFKNSAAWTAGIVLIVILVAGFYFYNYTGNYIPKKPLLVPSPTPDTSLLSPVPSDWKSYTDSTFGYTISHPPEFEVSSNGDNSSMIVKKTAPVGPGPSNFVYISVIPKGYEGKEGTIFNYNKKSIEIQKGMEVGEQRSMTVGESPDLSEWYTYTRLPDELIASEQAKVYINTRPWEFPAGTTEYRYIIIKGETTYIIGGYIGGQRVTGFGIPDSLFRQIIGTLTMKLL